MALWYGDIYGEGIVSSCDDEVKHSYDGSVVCVGGGGRRVVMTGIVQQVKVRGKHAGGNRNISE